MNRFSKLALAVATTLSVTPAFALDQASTNAAPTKLVAAGASAARDAFLLMFATEICQAGTVDVFRASPTTDQDFRAYSCTLKPSAGAGSVPELGTVGGTNATLYYRSEGGSAWGPASIVARQLNGSFPGVKSLDTTGACTGPTAVNYTIGSTVLSLPTWNCAVSGYNLSTDGFTSGALVDKLTQFGVADVEPKMFISSNYPSSTKFPQPYAAAFGTALKALARQTGFGQSFGILASNLGTNTGALTDITKQQATAIFSNGGYTNWNKIPGLPGGPITKVRREPGSGTQVAASAYLVNANCGDSYQFVVDNGTTVFERGTTSSLESTVAATADSVSFNVYKNPAPAGTHYLTINGVSGDRANVQAGTYDFAYELTLTQQPGLSGSSLAFAGALTAVSKKASLVPDAVSVFAIPSATNVPGSTVAGRPVARASRNGNSCLPFQGK